MGNLCPPIFIGRSFLSLKLAIPLLFHFKNENCSKILYDAKNSDGLL